MVMTVIEIWVRLPEVINNRKIQINSIESCQGSVMRGSDYSDLIRKCLYFGKLVA